MPRARRSTTAPLLGGSLLAAAGLSALAARAEPPLSLSWRAPEGCPSRETVLAEVTRLLGRDHARSSIQAEATVDKSGDGHRLRVILRGDKTPRVRELTAPTCEELGDAAALILALAIDPSAVASAPPRAVESDAGAPPSPPPSVDAGVAQKEPSAPPSAPPKDPPRPPPRRSAAAEGPPPAPKSLRTHAQIGLEIGAFRGAIPRAQVGLAFAMPPLRLEVAGMFAWGGRISAPSVPTAGAELWLAGGSLSGCFERALEGDARAPSAALCAFFEAAPVSAASFGVTSPDRAVAPWIAPGAQLLVRWPFSRRAALRLDVGLAIPVVELSFNIEGLGRVHRIGAVSGRSGLGVELDIF